VWIVMLLTVIGVVPTVVAVLASLFFPSPWLTVASVVVGVLNGWLAAWLFGNFAIRYLTTRMPDVFSRIRYGQVFRDKEDTVLGWVESTTLQGEQKLVAQRKNEGVLLRHNPEGGLGDPGAGDAAHDCRAVAVVL
jgi:ABC-2 type transport system permease protein